MIPYIRHADGFDHQPSKVVNSYHFFYFKNSNAALFAFESFWGHDGPLYLLIFFHIILFSYFDSFLDW